MYTNVRYTIKVNELFTDYSKVDQGVKQDAPSHQPIYSYNTDHDSVTISD